MSQKIISGYLSYFKSRFKTSLSTFLKFPQFYRHIKLNNDDTAIPQALTDVWTWTGLKRNVLDKKLALCEREKVLYLRSRSKKTSLGEGKGYLKLVTNGDTGEGLCSNGDVTTVYFWNVHVSYIWNYLPRVPSPTCILEKQPTWVVVCDSD